MLILGNFSNKGKHIPSQLGRSPNIEFFPVVVHEMSHALGIARTFPKTDEDTYRFGNVLTPWKQHLHDKNGNRAKPNQKIIFQGDPYDPEGFDISTAQLYFKGKHIDEVFDVTGRLAGQSAAIYMADNALVKQINIMKGAQLQGDILSLYNQRAEANQQRLTQLTFGQLPNEQGQSTGQPEATFSFDYRGNIQGLHNLAVTVQSVYLALNGEHPFYAFKILRNASVSGNSRYTLHTEGEFLNQGSLSVANSSLEQVKLIRQLNPYSPYSTNQNDLAVAQVLDRLTRTTDPKLQSLYRALDFPKADGSEISSALSKLSATTYSVLFTTALNREHQITNLMNEAAFAFVTPTSKRNESRPVWHSFAVPFGERFQQTPPTDRIGYSTSNFGVLFGQHNVQEQAWQWGLQGVASHQTTNTQTVPAQGDQHSFSVGVHGHYAVNPLERTYLFGPARVGIENSKWERNSYSRLLKPTTSKLERMV